MVLFNLAETGLRETELGPESPGEVGSRVAGW